MSTSSQFCSKCGNPIESGTRFCGGCGDLIKQAATPALAEPAIQTAVITSTGGGWNMPSVVWLILGLLFAGLMGGGLFVLLKEPPQPGAAYDNLSPAEKEKKFKEIADDIEPDPVNLEKATHPTDLPEKVQKKYDNSTLSDEHNRAVDAALAPLEKPLMDGQLVSTNRSRARKK